MSALSLEDLEMRLAYQDAALEQLSDTVYAQSREIEKLRERCRELEARVTALADGERTDGANNAAPPHY